MHTAFSFTTLSASGTRFRMAPNACARGKDSGVRLPRPADSRALKPGNPPAPHPNASPARGHPSGGAPLLGRTPLNAWAGAGPGGLGSEHLPQRWRRASGPLGPLPPCRLSPTTGRLTFLWKVPSRAATITVFPELAMASLNSTMSGNCRVWVGEERVRLLHPERPLLEATGTASPHPGGPATWTSGVLRTETSQDRVLSTPGPGTQGGGLSPPLTN